MPKGKYAEYLKDTPRYLGDDQSYLDKVNEAKRKIAKEPLPLSTLAKMYVAAREEYAQVDKLLKAIGVKLEATEQLLVQTMEAEDVSSLKLDTGRSISTWIEPYPQVTDQEAFRQWCVENGLERSLRLWPATTTSLVKQRLMDGKPEPPGITIYSRNIVRMGSER